SKQDQFVGLDAPSVQLLALVSYKLPKVTLGANAGAIIRKTAEYENDGGIIRITQGSGFAWSVGAAFRANERLSVSAEMFGEVNRGGFGGTGYTSPADGLVGLHYGAGSVTVGLAVGRGISRALGTPDIRGVLEVAFSPLKGQRAPNPPPPPTERDTDDDGIVDANDKCPTDKEDHIGNVADGCPLLDTDHDGVADADDKCPLEGEDKDAFQDEDGCPDLDDDADTIPDTQDKCPDAAETINGVDDNDGCPDKATTTAVDVSGSKTPQQAAEEAFKQGRVFIKEKNFAQACSAFELSQRLDPQFGTQYNLAGCYVELGKLATALNLYRELGRTDSNAARKTAAVDNAKRLAPRVPKVVIKLKTAVPGAQIFMNNVDSTALVGLEIPVDLGRYEVVAGATNYKPFRTSFEVKEEAKTTTITVDLQQ
ncbi:MAG TPA: hypothetical protein VL326_19405, partial [Kofleriaceae bacterium]|nr:hypothetical protein [Kofleriaceae bacterium]